MGLFERIDRSLDTYKALNEELKLLRDELQKQSSTLDEQRRRISSLDDRVRHLAQSSEDHLSVRRRFLDGYKSDIRAMDKLEGSKMVHEGNLVARTGDAFGDAVLFDRDQCTDREIYRELYGLDYDQVLDIRTYMGCLFNTLCQKLTIYRL